MKNKIAKLIRPECKNFQPYIAGKPIEVVQKELHRKLVYKLASNESPYGPCPEVRRQIKNDLKNIHLYPDSDSLFLRQAIARKEKIPAQNIIVGAGSDELIEIIAKTFFNPDDNIIVSEHAFIRYQMAGDLMGSQVKPVPMKNYRHNLVAMANAVDKKTKAVFIANPNNPTGTYNSKSELKKFLNILKEKNTRPLVIVDEAYYEYARLQKDYCSAKNFFRIYPYLIILRTFSKAYGLAGIRLGYLLTASTIASYLNRVRPPFSVNRLAQTAGIVALSNQKYIQKVCRITEDEKRKLYRHLKNLGMFYLPSATNFILVKTTPLSGKTVFQRLLRRGIIVRAMDEYKLPQYIRITVGKPAENKKLIQELKEVRK